MSCRYWASYEVKLTPYVSEGVPKKECTAQPHKLPQYPLRQLVFPCPEAKITIHYRFSRQSDWIFRGVCSDQRSCKRPSPQAASISADTAAARVAVHLLIKPSVDLEYPSSAAMGRMVTPMIARSRYERNATPQLRSMTACHAALWLRCWVLLY